MDSVPDQVDTAPPFVDCPDDEPTARIVGEHDLEAEAAVSFITGPENTLFGYSVAAVGDVTGDGLADLAVIDAGEPSGGDLGAAFLLPGPIPIGVVDPHVAGILFQQGPESFGPQLWTPPTFGSMAALPDVTGDGVAELVLGHGWGGLADGGAVWVMASPVGTAGTVVDTPDAAWATMYGLCGERLGHAVAVGDVTGDGESDLVVSAPYASDDDYSFPGKGCVLLGPLRAGDYGDGSVFANLFGESFDPSDPVGHSVLMGEQALVVDLDGDGVSEVTLTSPFSSKYNLGDGYGRAYTWQGPIAGDMDTTDAIAVYEGRWDGDYLGTYANPLGDTNGDGYPEIGLSSLSGEVENYHVWMVDGLAPGTGPISDFARTELRGDGWAPASAADLDQDGTPDVAIGASDLAGDPVGGVYVFYSPLPEGTVPVEQCADALLVGPANYTNPTVIAGSEDLTGDGAPDLAVGLKIGDMMYIVPGGAL